MRTPPEPLSDPGLDTPPEAEAAADAGESDFARIERQVRRRNVARHVGEGFAEVAKAVPELVVDILEMLLP